MTRRLLGMVLVFAVSCGLLTLLMARSEILFGPYTVASHAVRALLMAVLVVGAVAAVCRLVDRRRLVDLGLPPSRAVPGLLLGAALWLVPAAVAAGALIALSLVQLAPQQPAGEVLLGLFGLLVLVALFEALPEELVFRGYLYRNLQEVWPRWAATLGQAGLFVGAGLISGVARSPERVVTFALFALTLGVLRAHGGTVWVAMGFHLAFQAVAQHVLGSRAESRPFAIVGEDWLAVVAFGLVPFATASAGLLGRAMITRRVARSNSTA